MVLNFGSGEELYCGYIASFPGLLHFFFFRFSFSIIHGSTLPLPGIILIVNRRTNNGGGLGMKLVHTHYGEKYS